MIYCPSCKKPSATHTGNCPHCGNTLNGRSNAGQRGSANAAAPAQSNSQLRFGGADIEMDTQDDAENISLELQPCSEDLLQHGAESKPAVGISSPFDSVSPAPTTVTANALSRRQLSSSTSTVGEIAKFGDCEAGIIGAMKYGMCVYQRLPQLKAETDTAQKNKDIAWNALEKAKASLGRTVYMEKVDSPDLNRLIIKAQKADGKLDDIQREKDNINLEFKKKYDAFDSQQRRIEQIIEPIKNTEQKIQSEFNNISKLKARQQAKIKRTEIELRNIANLIEKKQAAYADLEKPKEERTHLLKEISAFDHKQVPLQNNLVQEQKTATQLEAPFNELFAKLNDIQTQLNKYNEQLKGFTNQRNAVQAEHDQLLQSIFGKAQGESKQAQQAWASVGERVYVNKSFTSPAIQRSAQQVEAKAAAFFAAQEKETLFKQAIDSYNKAAYDQAKKYWMIAGIFTFLLIILILSSIIF